jgi:hypothetical protein
MASDDRLDELRLLLLMHRAVRHYRAITADEVAHHASQNVQILSPASAGFYQPIIKVATA